MATARKLPSGNWRTRVYIGQIDGKSKYKSFTAPTKREAERLANEFAYKTEAMQTGNVTLQEAFDFYIETKSNIWSPTTLNAYESIAKTHFNDIKHYKLSKLNKMILQKEVNSIASKLSPKTTRNIVAFLTSTLKAYDIEYTFTLPQKKKTDINIPTKEDIEKLISMSDGDLRTTIIMSAYTGMRRAEIAALTPQDVDFENKTITVNKAKYERNGTEGVKQPKTWTSNRILPMPNIVAELLDESCFPIKKSMDSISQAFSKRAKYLENHIRLHDLRHYYASVMLRLGVPDKYAAELMGHSSTNMLKQVYQHTMQDYKKNISVMLNDYFESNDTKQTQNQ